MTTMRQFVAKSALLVTVALLATSCLDHDNDPELIGYPDAIVTVKTAPDKTVFLQLDEETTLLPTNFKSHPFKGKQVRALVNYDKDPEAAHEGYSEAVHVNWIDSILTKRTVPSVEDNDVEYGKDPINLDAGNVLIEDGYMTLSFVASFGLNSMRPHIINLVTGVNPDDPYEVELRHNAQGDFYPGSLGRGLVAFDLSDLPDTKGEEVTLTLRFFSFGSTKEIKMDYTTGKSNATPGTGTDIAKTRANISVE